MVANRKRLCTLLLWMSLVPLCGFTACLPEADQLRDSALVSTRDFVLDIVTIGIGNVFEQLAET